MMMANGVRIKIKGYQNNHFHEKWRSICSTVRLLHTINMPSEHSLTSMDNNDKSNWLWPVLILAIAVTLISGMIYAQKVMQQVETIEQNQVSQYESRKFMLTQPDVLNINWMRTLNPLAKNIQGDVVWSSLMQQGMMRFANLTALPKGQQYHLWIYDLTSPADEPVSIVSFSPDLKIPTELLIPFTSSKTINEPYKFMVMLEYEDENVTPEPLLLAQP